MLEVSRKLGPILQVGEELAEESRKKRRTRPAEGVSGEGVKAEPGEGGKEEEEEEGSGDAGAKEVPGKTDQSEELPAVEDRGVFEGVVNKQKQKPKKVKRATDSNKSLDDYVEPIDALPATAHTFDM